MEMREAVKKGALSICYLRAAEPKTHNHINWRGSCTTWQFRNHLDTLFLDQLTQPLLASKVWVSEEGAGKVCIHSSRGVLAQAVPHLLQRHEGK